jgi:dipeptidyl-peptidase-4
MACLTDNMTNLIRACRVLSFGLIASLTVPLAVAEDPVSDPALLTIDRIYKANEFAEKSYAAKWLDFSRDSNASYTTLESSEEYAQRHDILRHDAATGETSVLVSAADLIPPGTSTPLKIEDYAWSKNLDLLLIYTNSKRVWRQNTRGDYWLLDRSSRQLRKLGGDAPPATLMFAKLSPDGTKVAYVRNRNLYVEDLFDHSVCGLTDDQSDDIINGTTDWVYEEEFGLRDGFRWSPDSHSIAFWQIDTTGVQRFPLVNNIDSLYPTVHWFAYPKVGQRNPSCRIGLAEIDTSSITWVNLPGDPRQHYVPRLDFVPATGELLIQQLNRLQNTNRLFLYQAGQDAKEVLVDQDDAWVDVHDELIWLDDDNHFTWPSDRDGWRHVFIASRDGMSQPAMITPGEFDVVQVVDVDEPIEQLYFIASPGNATQRYLYRVGLDGQGMQRLTPEKFSGSNSYQISPDCKWAIHQWSSADHPTRTSLISLPDHKQVRKLEENEELVKKVEQLKRKPTELFRVDIGDGVLLDGWCIKPPDFDPEQKYPLLIYVYGEPAGSTVRDRWGGTSYLWHLMMAQHGYVVMSFDNRGTKAPRGREWRKSIYKKIGILPPQDQAAAVRAVLKDRPYLDATKVGIWGWSGGGSSSLQAVFKYPELYSTAIAVAPVPNQRYYDTIYQERYMATPDLNAEGFLEGSAINFAKQLEGNLLLVHGTADDNCHYATTEMLIDELVAHNKQFTMFAYPNRTHAVRERKNTTRHLRSMMTNFLLEKMPR